jgi:hypothetical protein
MDLADKKTESAQRKLQIIYSSNCLSFCRCVWLQMPRVVPEFVCTQHPNNKHSSRVRENKNSTYSNPPQRDDAAEDGEKEATNVC